MPVDQDQTLLKKTEAEYGAQYRDHFLEIYKLYVDTAEKTISRRQSANSFFLTVNTALIAVTGYIHVDGGSTPQYYWAVSLAGIILCLTWYRLIRSYRGLNSGKFRVISAMERQLPAAPFDHEWEILGKGKEPGKYLSFSKVEAIVPWVFLCLHAVVFLRALLKGLAVE
jgi:hypothetical protein